eukprot:6174344-Pleurochrysis_carterae.AAC.2
MRCMGPFTLAHGNPYASSALEVGFNPNFVRLKQLFYEQLSILSTLFISIPHSPKNRPKKFPQKSFVYGVAPPPQTCAEHTPLKSSFAKSVRLKPQSIVSPAL